MKATIVIPTIREAHARAWWDAWKGQLEGQRVIMVIDKPREESFSIEGVETYDYTDIDTELDDDSWVISKRTSAIRNFGTYKALQHHTDMIWHLDDDCLPSDGTELQRHFDNLYQPSPLNRWITTDGNGHNVRGVPYLTKSATPNVVVSHGTWLKNPDYDAAHQLANRFDFVPGDGIVPQGRYFPMCGMNLAFKPQAAPAMYFAPKSELYNRNDDIWMGIIAKRVFDHLRLSCYTGYPQIIHERASDPFKNLIAESHFIEANEYFWVYIDQMQLSDSSVRDCVREIARMMTIDSYRKELYFSNYGQALSTWVDLLPDPVQ